MSKKLGIGIIGFGGMAEFHVGERWTYVSPKESLPKMWIDNPNNDGRLEKGKNEYGADYFEPIGVWDIDPERNKVAVEKFGLEAFGSEDELINDPRIDVVLIATTNPYHKPLAIKVMKAGKFAIVEKPVTLSVKEFDEMCAVADDPKYGNFMVHQNRRWDADYLAVRNLYKNKEIGDLFNIESSVVSASWVPTGWRAHKADGGGMLLDWGVHLIDQMLNLTQDDDKLKSVYADLDFMLGHDVDDGFFAYFIFESGLKYVIDIQTTNYVEKPRWYFKGTAGTGIIKDWGFNESVIVKDTGAENAHVAIKAGAGLTKTMAPLSDEAKEVIPLLEPKADYAKFYKNVYEQIVDGAEPYIKHSENRKVLEVFDAIKKSYETNSVIKFD